MNIKHMINGEQNIGRFGAISLLIGTAILWSFGGILIKSVSWNPIAIAGARSAIAALLILIILRRPHLTWSLPQIGGAVAYASTVITFVAATKLTTAANAILLQYTAPVYVALLSVWLLKERIRYTDWITIFFVIGGMTLFFIDKLTKGGFLGNILAILSGISFACLVIFMRKQKLGSPLESAFLGNIATALIGLPFMFQSVPRGSGWIGLILMGLFQLGLSYILYSIAIKHVPALEAVLIPILEPILNPVWVFLILGEIPGRWAFLGGFIVIVSITLRYTLSNAKTSEAT